MWFVIAIIVFAVIFCAASLGDPSRLDLWLAERKPHESLWKKAFPEERQSDVNEFCEDFSQAFSLTRSQVFQLKPSDVVYTVYRKEYPRINGLRPDEMEYETLKIMMDERGLNSEILDDTTTTIRDLFVEYAGEPIVRLRASSVIRGSEEVEQGGASNADR